MTKKLLTWARATSGMGMRSGGAEFASQEALSAYLRAHPKANASKHSVKNANAAQQSQSAQPERHAQSANPSESSHSPAVEKALGAYNARESDPFHHGNEMRRVGAEADRLEHRLKYGALDSGERDAVKSKLKILNAKHAELAEKATTNQFLSRKEHQDMASAHAKHSDALRERARELLQSNPDPKVWKPLMDASYYHDAMDRFHTDKMRTPGRR